MQALEASSSGQSIFRVATALRGCWDLPEDLPPLDL